MDETQSVLPVTPWLLAAVATVLVVALSVPPGGPRQADRTAPLPPLHRPVVAAGLAAGVLALVLGARLGPDSELRNPVPALVVGLGWPLLLLLPALLGLVRPATACDPVRSVWPAVLPACALAAALTLPLNPARPDAVGTALAAYALVVLAGAVAAGRSAVAVRLEVLGLLAAWLTVGRRLPRWAAPPGALAVLAVVLGGAWFERYERTAAWSARLPDRADAVLGLLAALALAGLGALALAGATRRRGAAGTAAAVLLPLTAGTVLAGVVRRALISAQLLADQAAGSRAVDPDPLGIAGGQLLSLALVGLGGGLAAVVLARRTGAETARLPGLGVLLTLTAGSAWSVLQP